MTFSQEKHSDPKGHDARGHSQGRTALGMAPGHPPRADTQRTPSAPLTQTATPAKQSQSPTPDCDASGLPGIGDVASAWDTLLRTGVTFLGV